MSRTHIILSRCAGVVLIPLVLINGCEKQGKASSQGGAAAPAPVMVAEVEQRDVPLQIRSIATVEPFTMVTIKARVPGQLQKVHIKPGQEVKAGDLLFEIDPRPFQAALNEAQARFDRDTALARNAQIDSDRVVALQRDSVATREEADKARFLAEAAMATVRGDQASLDNAKLQMEYTKIFSPVDGRAGSVLTDEGNIVKADETQLLTLNQVRPIYVSFAVPEKDLELIRKQVQSSEPSVDVTTPPETTPSESGKLSFIDNLVDNETGTIRLKGTFENADRRLWPGQFVQASLNLTVERNALVIPSRALQTGQQGTFVFVLKPDMTVEMRPVKVRRAIGEDVVLEGGVAAGERVVTEGHLRLTPGAKAAIKEAPATRPEAGAAAP